AEQSPAFATESLASFGLKNSGTFHAGVHRTNRLPWPDSVVCLGVCRMNALRNGRREERNYPYLQANLAATPVRAELDFRTAFCKKFQCSREDFNERVFWKFLYRHALPFAASLGWMNREFFQPDLDLIHSLASTTTLSEVKAEASFIRHDQRMQAGFLRGTLRMRISGRRLADLASS